MNLDFKDVKSIKIKEGDVKSLSINGQVVWGYEETKPRANAFRFYNPGNEVNTLSVKGNPNFETSVDGLNWTPESPFTSIDIKPKQTLYLRGRNTTMSDKTFSSTKPIECHGSIMDLCDGGSDTKECTQVGQFHRVFIDMVTLLTAPDLPATKLKDTCYLLLFSGCTSLTQAPDLPATILAPWCYSGIFLECTELTKAPDLLAPSLADYCYHRMFSGCRKMNYVKLGTAAWDVTQENWLYGVSPTGNIEAPSLTFKDLPESASGCPTGWTLNGQVRPTPPPPPPPPTRSGFRFYNPNNTPITISYNGNNSFDISSDGVNWEKGVQFNSRSILPKWSLYIKGSSTSFGRFSSSGIFDCYGNIFDIVDPNDGVWPIDMLAGLFEDSSIRRAPDIKPLRGEGYTGIYKNMFRNCVQLQTPPRDLVLGDTFKEECMGMFQGCSKLTYSPEISARFTTVGVYDSLRTFSNMFYGCGSLTRINIKVNYWASNAFDTWVRGVSSSGLFENVGGISVSTGENGVPVGWTIQNI